MERKSEYISREELYELVWSKPSQIVAKDFGISDVALGKICRKLVIPKPPRGWWARKLAGERMQTPRLPNPQKDGRPGVWLTISPEQEKEPIEIDHQTLEIISSLDDPKNKIAVPDKLIRPHKLIRQARQNLRSSAPNMYGRLRGRWDEDCLDICVSKPSLDRALILFDTLIKNLEVLSLEIEIRRKHEIKTVVVSGKVGIEIMLYERANRFDEILTDVQEKDLWKYDKYRYEPSGELELTISRWPLNQRRWKDTALRRIEDRINEIVAEILISVELVKIEHEKRESERLRILEEERAKAEELQRRELEARRREALENLSSQWNRANELRLFLDACEKSMVERGVSLDADSSESRWLEWAHEHANRLDPCQSGKFFEIIRNPDETATNVCDDEQDGPTQ